MRTLKRRGSVAILVCGALVGGAAYAQQQAKPQQAPANRAAHSPTKLDEHVASCLILENDNEIAAAKIAEQHSSSAEVKEFARTMVKDHGQFAADLEKFAGAELRNRGQRTENRTGATTRNGTDNRTDNTRRDGRAPAANNAGVAARPNTAAQPGGHEPYATMLAIKQEIADECRSATQRELDSKKGDEFDDCYVGMQIAAHMHMVDSLKVLERHVSPELQPVLHKGLQTAQQHLDHAKKIMKGLDKNETARNEKTTKAE